MRKLRSIAFLLFAVSASYQAQKKLPNIIYIYADDLGYGSTATYGNPLIKTPNLDQLASQGMLFTQHYSSAPVCAPARGMLMTGKHGGHAYIRGNYELGEFDDAHEGGQMPLPEGTYTLPKMLKSVGYTTAVIGKWALGMPNNSGNPNEQGVDFFYGLMDQKQAHSHYPTHLWRNNTIEKLNNPPMNVHQALNPKTATEKDFEAFKGKDYAPKKMLDEALAFIDRTKKTPFFLYFPTTLPHVSLQVPDEYRDRYVGKFDEPEYYYGEKGYAAVKYPYSTFAGMITYLDMQVGEIMKKVKEAGLEENTIIMFSSDNGGSLESGIPNDLFKINAPFRGFKRDLYEGGIREPFIIKWPGKVKAGSHSGLVSAQFDVMATLADITGVKLEKTDGKSFLPTLLGQPSKQEKHPYLYWEFGETGGAVAIRMGKWKGVKTGLKKNINAPWQIYDLEKDLQEQHDISSQHPELIKTFDEIVKKEHRNAHIREWEFVNPKFIR
ncbi:arylsulfatase [Elizabethkingia sp. JS20170427COW]|uniref:arylsulfatase n=1 Tax=Elizabethkingia sp. JS20170427COW TaxID=2583851 RepID=UPI0011101330|nr:arylsulfatase [Elizabethkingia sp. JS20170427COW]QCX54141.1 arylsulfatase [Elizabethkingia sp. JS20170427COW]